MIQRGSATLTDLPDLTTAEFYDGRLRQHASDPAFIDRDITFAEAHLRAARERDDRALVANTIRLGEVRKFQDRQANADRLFHASPAHATDPGTAPPLLRGLRPATPRQMPQRAGPPRRSTRRTETRTGTTPREG
jgi:hypothetical protein